MQFRRYAIYYTPPRGPLAGFGATWLGWDSTKGEAVLPPLIGGLPAPVQDITAQPRKYGFHGTIKPPLRLAEGKTRDAFLDAVRDTAKRLSPITLEGLELNSLGRFLAFTPVGPTGALANFAATVVQELDMFRAPPTDAELAKRRRSRLSPAQEAHLMRWGYPYVIDQFRFHMTMTGPMSPQDLAQTKAALDPIVQDFLPKPLVIHDLTVLGEAEDGMFHVLERVPLGG